MGISTYSGHCMLYFIADIISETWLILLVFTVFIGFVKYKSRKTKYKPKHIFDRGKKGDWDNCSNIGFH
jgi:hypothetical protein